MSEDGKTTDAVEILHKRYIGKEAKRKRSLQAERDRAKYERERELVSDTDRRREFKVSLIVPAEVTDMEMKSYIDEAVCTWQGQMHPDEPLRNLKHESVRVTRIYKRQGR